MTSLPRRNLLRGAAALALLGCPLCRTALAAETGAHWAYEGEDGPAHWGELAQDYSVCSIGREQSPIDLADATHADLAALTVDWKTTRLAVLNNGHTIQVPVEPGSTLTLDGKPYELKQFHFHHPSEHALAGEHHPMEAHFVHAAADGPLAVVGIFLVEGQLHTGLAEIFAAMPHKRGEMDTGRMIEPALFLPGTRRYWRYEGSLTTPPCSEVVHWLVLADPLEVGAREIDAFAALFPNNARPLQDRHRRFLLSSF